MPWEVTIVNYEGRPPASYRAPDRPESKPLGGREEVIAHIKQALPELEWGESGNFPPEILQTFSPEIRALMSKSQVQAVHDGEDFSIELYAFEQEPIMYLHADIRGEGNPLVLLDRMCSPRKWSVVSNFDGSVVDLQASSAAQWDFFRAWRNRAIATTSEEA